MWKKEKIAQYSVFTPDGIQTIYEVCQQDKIRLASSHDIAEILAHRHIPVFNPEKFMKIIKSFWHKSYALLDVGIGNVFFEKLISDYKEVSALWSEFKNKFHIKHAIEKDETTWFSARYNGKYDFFTYREEFTFSPVDTQTLTYMKETWGEKFLAFLDQMEYLSNACIFQMYTFINTYKMLQDVEGSVLKDDILAKVFLENPPRARLTIWDYTTNNTSENLNADAHVDSSLLNAVVYQSAPWLQVNHDGFHEGIYTDVVIPPWKMALLAWRDIGAHASSLAPTWHKVQTNAPERISIWFAFNPHDYIQTLKKFAPDAYKDFIS